MGQWVRTGCRFMLLVFSMYRFMYISLWIPELVMSGFWFLLVYIFFCVFVFLGLVICSFVVWVGEFRLYTCVGGRVCL